MGRLEPGDRDVFLWRHSEQVSVRETPELLHITEAAAAKRHIRPLGRLSDLPVYSGVNPRR
jgi:hypothetical protein